jgi:hypothetical protein
LKGKLKYTRDVYKKTHNQKKKKYQKRHGN